MTATKNKDLFDTKWVVKKELFENPPIEGINAFDPNNFKEVSKSGQAIYRHDVDQQASTELIPPINSGKYKQNIFNHTEKYIGNVDFVFHSNKPDFLDLSIYWIKPSGKYPFHVLVTSGISDRPMNVDSGFENHKYIELCILLPKDWPLDESFNKLLDNPNFSPEENTWPLYWLNYLAHMPYKYNTWLYYGHTIYNDSKLVPNTDLACLMLINSTTLPDKFFELFLDKEKVIDFYCVIPLYQEEMIFKINNGVEKLFKKFPNNTISDIIDMNRENVCKRKKWFGIW